jgi:hypothetical protein
MSPVTGCIAAAPSSLLASLPVGGACGLLVSLAVEGPTLPDRVIEGGAPCESRLSRLRVGVPEPIPEIVSELGRIGRKVVHSKLCDFTSANTCLE